MVASFQLERRPKLGYFKNEAIEDWSPEPRPKPVSVHVSLQTRRRDMRRKPRDYTTAIVSGGFAFFLTVGIILGRML
jgi:hypothetical protein